MNYLKTLLLCLTGTAGSLSGLAQQDDGDLRRGIVWEDPKENYKVKFSFRIQPQFSFNTRDFDMSETPELENLRFRMRRARLKLDGYIGSPNWVYKIEFDMVGNSLGGLREHPSFGGRIFLDAVIKYQIDGGRYAFWIGQTKLPGNRERVVSSANLQFVDRHIVNSRFNLDRDMGIQFHGKEKLGSIPMNWAVALSMGEGRNIAEPSPGGLQYTGRVEFLPLGHFKNKGDYIEADIFREPAPRLAVGATVDWNNDAVRSQANQGRWFEVEEDVYAQRDIRTLMLDVMGKYRGWSLLCEYVYREIDDPVIYDIDDNLLGSFYAGSGISAQAGYVFRSNWEVAGRYSAIQPANNVIAGDFNQYTMAVSRYIRGHNVKVQADLTLTDYLTDGMDDPLQFRLQVELGI